MAVGDDEAMKVCTLGKCAPEQIDAIISNSPDWRGVTLSRLRGLILGAAPGIVEEVKWKKPSRPEGVPVWSLNGILCTGEMLKGAVRLTFPKGRRYGIKRSSSTLALIVRASVPWTSMKARRCQRPR